MFAQKRDIRGAKFIMILSVIWLGVLNSSLVDAGGLIAYEFGTAEVGLASAGYGARAALARERQPLKIIDLLLPLEQ